MNCGDERGAGLSGVSCDACCNGDRFTPIVSISLWDNREEVDDKGVNGLGGGDGSQQWFVEDDSCSTITSECGVRRGPV